MGAPDQLDPLAAIARTRRSIVAMGALLGATAILALATGPARAQGGDDQGGGGQGGDDQGGGGQGGNSQGGGHNGGGGHSCLLRGTHIRTPEGNKKIDEIKIGDLVLTRSGETKPVLWVARHRYHRKPGVPWARDIAPIRITRDALAPGSPTADLFLSDRHALYLDGVPILGFVGGRSALASRWRSAVSPLVDRRTRLDRIRDDLEERAERLQPLPAAA